MIVEIGFQMPACIVRKQETFIDERSGKYIIAHL